MQKLTARQQEILDLIKHYIDSTGYPPTRADIAKELGFRSANAAEEHLKALARKGAIEMIAGASRGIRIPDYQDGIPIIGRVAAGSPILAQEHIEEHVQIPPSLFHPSADFLLRVHGDSMIEIGINDGDLLAVKKAQEAREGQVVVARIGDEVTVKRLKKTDNPQILLLLPENAEYQPIEVNLAEQEFAIEGLSVGVIRQNVH